MCAVTIPLWRCKKCPWEGFIRTGHQFTFQILPDGEIQGPFERWLDLIEALKKAPKEGGIKLTVKAQCPKCGSWEMTKEDIPVDDNEVWDVKCSYQP